MAIPESTVACAASLLEGFEELSVAEYGEFVIMASPPAEGAQLQENNGIPWFEYKHISPEGGKQYNYLTCVYKAGDAFWAVQFIAPIESADGLRADFMNWAATVRFE